MEIAPSFFRGFPNLISFCYRQTRLKELLALDVKHKASVSSKSLKNSDSICVGHMALGLRESKH